VALQWLGLIADAQRLLDRHKNIDFLRCSLRRPAAQLKDPKRTTEGRSRLVRGPRLFKQVLCFRQIRLHQFMVSGKDFVRINLQGASVSGHRLSQQFGAFGTPGPDGLLLEREAQVVLGGCPVLRQLLAGPDFQGAAVRGHRLGQQFRCLGDPYVARNRTTRCCRRLAPEAQNPRRKHQGLSFARA